MTVGPFLHKVLYRECDMMGVVNNANYVHFMEDARVDALSRIGCEYKGMEERGFAGPVIRLAVEYKSPARFGDEMELLVTFERYTGVRLCLSYVMRDRASGRVFATATSEHCFISMSDGAPVLVSKQFPDWDKALREASCGEST